MFVAAYTNCEICGTSRNLETHHIVPRRMGGSRRPEIEATSNKAVLCHSCHTQITEQRWRLERTDQELLVTDVATGQVVARRLFNSDFRPSEYFHELNLLEGRLDILVQGIPYLTDDQLVDLFSYFRGVDQRAWKAQAAILWEAKRPVRHRLAPRLQPGQGVGGVLPRGRRDILQSNAKLQPPGGHPVHRGLTD
jgi:hypothetical protein